MIVDDFKNEDGEWARTLFVDGKYIQTRACSIYRSIIERCRPGGRHQRLRPTYIGTVSEFVDFQDFAEWCQTQVGYGVQGYQVDKDFLSSGKKRYAKDTCVFIPAAINNLVIKVDAARGEFPLGVSADKDGICFVANIRMFSKLYCLGKFSTPEEAFTAYKERKEKHIKVVAGIYKESIDPRVYAALMSYEVRITD